MSFAAECSPPWGHWYETHAPALRRYLVRSLGPDRQLADDLLQDVYFRAIAGGGQLPAGEDPKSWLFRIATNLLIDHYRRSTRRNAAQTEMITEVDPARSPEAETIRDDLRRRIRDAIARLPEAQREVFLLREYGDVPFKEIALRTGAPLGTVLGRMRYAMLRIQTELGAPKAGIGAPNSERGDPGPHGTARLELGTPRSNLGAPGHALETPGNESESPVEGE